MLELIGFGVLLPAGRQRLRAWLADVLRYPQRLEAYAVELEATLASKLGDKDCFDVFLPAGQVIEGRPRRFELREGEYALPSEAVDDDEECKADREPEPLHWRDLGGEDRVCYAAAAIAVSEYGVGFVVDPDEQATLMQAVQAMPLPPRFQEVLGKAATRVWRRYGKTAEHYQGPLLALHVFAREHEADFDTAWGRVLTVLSGDLSRLRYSITLREPRLQAEHRSFPPTAEQRQVFSRRLSAWRLAEYNTLRAARDAADPTLNGKPQPILTAPRGELECSFTWWSLQLGFIVESKLRDAPAYVEVADELADRCMRFMPLAQEQAHRARRDDRYGTKENSSLPKYARWLLARGLPERAATVCRLALNYRIEPKSPGAFERELARAEKKIVLRAKSADDRTAPKKRSPGVEA